MLFTKVHGLGNDFVLVEAFTGFPVGDPAALARDVCDRHFGVGADGLVFLTHSSVADFGMRIWNADGSEAEMCGNAIRCLGKYVYEHALWSQDELTVETLAGVKCLGLHLDGEQVTAVTVDMGHPILDPALIPVGSRTEPFLSQPVAARNAVYRVTAVSMGNPHAVVFVPDLTAIDLRREGPNLERNPLFPLGANVEFVQVVEPELVKMLVWERGAGPTLACGTGACAVAVAAILNGLTKEQLWVELPGGRLHIQWRDREQVFMTGPAVEVYRGEWQL